jgi:DeoR/GlpR family transcriptional regulator of sugar metabolism
LLIIKKLLELQHIDVEKKEATAKLMSLTGISENTARKYLNQIRELD